MEALRRGVAVPDPNEHPRMQRQAHADVTNAETQSAKLGVLRRRPPATAALGLTIQQGALIPQYGPQVRHAGDHVRGCAVER